MPNTGSSGCGSQPDRQGRAYLWADLITKGNYGLVNRIFDWDIKSITQLKFYLCISRVFANVKPNASETIINGTVWLCQVARNRALP